jgi:hypothetical protein
MIRNCRSTTSNQPRRITMLADIKTLRLMVRGAYDLQSLRMQSGLRLCGNFRARLKERIEADADDEDDRVELSEEAVKVIDEIKSSYRRLTDGVARRRTLPEEKGFTGDALISNFTELVLVSQYIDLEAQEQKQFRQMTATLEVIPVYQEFLTNERGIGPAMAAVLITYFDPHKARHVSSFWKYAGLDVAQDGAARSRRKEHLIEREYTNRNGDKATRLSTTYNPWLRMKLLGGLGPSFLRSASPRRSLYDNYRQRILTDPDRKKVTVVEWKRAFHAGEEVRGLWTPGRIHKAALRYMVKIFLIDFWTKWRELEGLPVTPSYNEARRGYAHGSEAAE